MIQTKAPTRTTPPRYTRLDDSTALVYEWVGGRENGITQYIYDIQIQTRYGRAQLIGQIERHPRTGCWLINYVDRQPLRQAESLSYDDYSQAVEYLYEQHQQRKRTEVRHALA